MKEVCPGNGTGVKIMCSYHCDFDIIVGSCLQLKDKPEQEP